MSEGVTLVASCAAGYGSRRRRGRG